MKNIVTILSFVISTSSFSQKIDNLITEKSVSRVIKSLTTDEMMGRPALLPGRIEKATAFIENEFKTIGLRPLKGATGFRQAFNKDRITLSTLEVFINDEKQVDENLILVSDKKDVNLRHGLTIKTIEYDNQTSNPSQFFRQVFELANDTTSALIFVAPGFESNFKRLKNYFSQRFSNESNASKIFILGKKIDVSSYSVKATQAIETIKMTNVVGIVEGKSQKDEMVVFSGHYDHLGILPANASGDSIANGADDDASGTTAVIELARYFKKINHNARTLVFVAFTAEELGGFGSQYFSKQLNADKVMAMFNIEMIGKPSKWGQNSAFITGFERSDFGPILQKNLEGSVFKFNPDPYPEQNLFYRSDNATLAKLGVPAHTISTDQIDIDKLYHSVDDEFESMDIKNITNTIKAIALSAQSIIEGKDTPKRIDKSTVD